MRHLQVLYEKYKDKGLVILGFNFSDDKKIALNFLRDNSATFPNILDTSDEAIKTGFITYGAAATPVNYVLDREGKIIDAPSESTLYGDGTIYLTREDYTKYGINDPIGDDGWPILDPGTPYDDTDHDGMPNDWELAYCLDPYDPSDANGDRDGDGYTNIEEYINWLPLKEPMPSRADFNCDNVVDLCDFSEFAKHYWCSLSDPLYDKKCDFNNDDVITIEDFFYITQDWLWFNQD